jgi:GT2 family glycosyltransferase
MQVSVIIVNYNTLNLTRQCIDSILYQTFGIDFEIILIDNNSQDGSKQFFEKNPIIKYIYSEQNLGFGKANNLGYKYASGEYIFLLNSDTILLNNAIKCFYDIAERMPQNIACFGAKLLMRDGITQGISYGSFPSFKSVFNTALAIYFPFISASTTNLDQGSNFVVDYITGADLFIRRKVIDLYGLFDPDFFMYFEETEMQKRYLTYGYKSMIIDSPRIIHLEGHSISKNLGSKRTLKGKRLYFEGMFIYMKKKYSLIGYVLFRIMCLSFLPLFLRLKYGKKEIIGLFKLFILPLKSQN